MASANDVQGKISALEQSLRQAAFAVLEDSRSYDQAKKLLQLAESLKELEAEFVEVMRPASAEDDAGECGWWGRTYPRFRVREGRLVKEGKGKKSLVPYSQEVDRGGFDVVVRWIAKHDEEPWQMGEMVEDLAGELAGYKPYVVVGALVESGLVRKVKRGAYRAAAQVSIDDWWLLLERGPQVIAEPTQPASRTETFEDDIPF